MKYYPNRRNSAVIIAALFASIASATPNWEINKTHENSSLWLLNECRERSCHNNNYINNPNELLTELDGGNLNGVQFNFNILSAMRPRNWSLFMDKNHVEPHFGYPVYVAVTTNDRRLSNPQLVGYARTSPIPNFPSFANIAVLPLVTVTSTATLRVSPQLLKTKCGFFEIPCNTGTYRNFERSLTFWVNRYRYEITKKDRIFTNYGTATTLLSQLEILFLNHEPTPEILERTRTE